MLISLVFFITKIFMKIVILKVNLENDINFVVKLKLLFLFYFQLVGCYKLIYSYSLINRSKNILTILLFLNFYPYSGVLLT